MWNIRCYFWEKFTIKKNKNKWKLRVISNFPWARLLYNAGVQENAVKETLCKICTVAMRRVAVEASMEWLCERIRPIDKKTKICISTVRQGLSDRPSVTWIIVRSSGALGHQFVNSWDY